MRVASFNILHGRSLADGRVDNDRLAAACASLDADVLCLQEVDRGQHRSHGADQVAEVAAALGAADWRFAPALVGEPGATWRTADGTEPEDASAAAYGIGLVSRLEVRAWHTMWLRAAPVRSPVAVPGGRGRFILLPDEPRVVLAAEIDTPGGGLVVATTHLSFVPVWNLLQIRRATRQLEAIAAGRPCVLLGDMNFPGPLPALVSGWRHLSPRVATYPGARPRIAVDQVLGYGPLPPVATLRAAELPLSDHRALVLDFAG